MTTTKEKNIPASEKKKAAPRKKKQTESAPSPVIIHGFKGFDANMQCRGKQYAIGGTYEEPAAKLCKYGIHFVENPMDAWNYYPPIGGHVCNVDAENPTDEYENDSKRVTTKLTVGAKIDIAGIVKASVDYTKTKATREKAASTGNDANNASTGYKANNASTGNYANNASTGNYANNASTGNYANNASTGDKANNASTGNGANSIAAGDFSFCSVKGKNSVAAVVGRNGRARACIGSGIVLVERNEAGEILNMRCAIVDGEILKPDVFYILENGEFVEAEDRS